MYHWFNNSKNEVQKHILEYVKVINSDGKIHNQEMEHLIQLAEKNGMRGSEVKTLISGIDQSKIKAPQNDDERFEQLFYLVNLVLTDSMLNAEEFDFCREVGEKMGYPHTKAGLIVKEMHNGIKRELEEKEIKAKVQKLL
ncbi:MAG: hypothetical protein ACJ75J_12010 [Cytophagaceae bacterium]